MWYTKCNISTYIITTSDNDISLNYYVERFYCLIH